MRQLFNCQDEDWDPEKWSPEQRTAVLDWAQAHGLPELLYRVTIHEQTVHAFYYRRDEQGQRYLIHYDGSDHTGRGYHECEGGVAAWGHRRVALICEPPSPPGALVSVA